MKILFERFFLEEHKLLPSFSPSQPLLSHGLLPIFVASGKLAISKLLFF
jgi:hypothetical protein